MIISHSHSLESRHSSSNILVEVDSFAKTLKEKEFRIGPLLQLNHVNTIFRQINANYIQEAGPKYNWRHDKFSIFYDTT